MSGYRKVAELALSLYRSPELREHLQEVNPPITDQKLAHLAATHALKSERDEGLIDNFGREPTIDEVSKMVLKLSGEGE
jgi:hypothetical protein